MMVPPDSRLRAENRMRLNEFDDQDLELNLVLIDRVIVLALSESDRKMAESLNNLEASINSDGSPVMKILKYSFVLRFVSNNQIMILSSFLEVHIPINFHISTQALSSGMKPGTELYR